MPLINLSKGTNKPALLALRNQADSAAPDTDALTKLMIANQRMQQRIVSSGAPDPTKKKNPSALEKIFGVIGVPETAITTAVHNILDPDAPVNILGEMGKSFRGETHLGGYQTVEALGLKSSNPIVNMITGLGVEMLLDPLTYVGVGTPGKLKDLVNFAVDGLYSGTKTLDTIIDATKLGKYIGSGSKFAEWVVQDGDEIGRLINPKSMPQELASELWDDVAEAVGAKGGLRFMGMNLTSPRSSRQLARKIRPYWQGQEGPALAKGILEPTSKWLQKTFAHGGIIDTTDLMREGNELSRSYYTVEKRALQQITRNSVRMGRKFAESLVDEVPDEAVRDGISMAVARHFGDVENVREMAKGFNDVYRYEELQRNALMDALREAGIKVSDFDEADSPEALNAILDVWEELWRKRESLQAELKAAERNMRGVKAKVKEAVPHEPGQIVARATPPDEVGRPIISPRTPPPTPQPVKGSPGEAIQPILGQIDVLRTQAEQLPRGHRDLPALRAQIDDLYAQASETSKSLGGSTLVNPGLKLGPLTNDDKYVINEALKRLKGLGKSTDQKSLEVVWRAADVPQEHLGRGDMNRYYVEELVDSVVNKTDLKPVAPEAEYVLGPSQVVHDMGEQWMDRLTAEPVSVESTRRGTSLMDLVPSDASAKTPTFKKIKGEPIYLDESGMISIHHTEGEIGWHVAVNAEGDPVQWLDVVDIGGHSYTSLAEAKEGAARLIDDMRGSLNEAAERARPRNDQPFRRLGADGALEADPRLQKVFDFYGVKGEPIAQDTIKVEARVPQKVIGKDRESRWDPVAGKWMDAKVPYNRKTETVKETVKDAQVGNIVARVKGDTVEIDVAEWVLGEENYDDAAGLWHHMIDKLVEQHPDLAGKKIVYAPIKQGQKTKTNRIYHLLDIPPGEIRRRELGIYSRNLLQPEGTLKRLKKAAEAPKVELPEWTPAHQAFADKVVKKLKTAFKIDADAEDLADIKRIVGEYDVDSLDVDVLWRLTDDIKQRNRLKSLGGVMPGPAETIPAVAVKPKPILDAPTPLPRPAPGSVDYQIELRRVLEGRGSNVQGYRERMEKLAARGEINAANLKQEFGQGGGTLELADGTYGGINYRPGKGITIDEGFGGEGKTFSWKQVEKVAKEVFGGQGQQPNLLEEGTEYAAKGKPKIISEAPPVRINPATELPEETTRTTISESRMHTIEELIEPEAKDIRISEANLAYIAQKYPEIDLGNGSPLEVYTGIRGYLAKVKAELKDSPRYGNRTVDVPIMETRTTTVAAKETGAHNPGFVKGRGPQSWQKAVEGELKERRLDALNAIEEVGRTEDDLMVWRTTTSLKKTRAGSRYKTRADLSEQVEVIAEHNPQAMINALVERASQLYGEGNEKMAQHYMALADDLGDWLIDPVRKADPLDPDAVRAAMEKAVTRTETVQVGTSKQEKIGFTLTGSKAGLPSVKVPKDPDLAAEVEEKLARAELEAMDWLDSALERHRIDISADEFFAAYPDRADAIIYHIYNEIDVPDSLVFGRIEGKRGPRAWSSWLKKEVQRPSPSDGKGVLEKELQQVTALLDLTRILNTMEIRVASPYGMTTKLPQVIQDLIYGARWVDSQGVKHSEPGIESLVRQITRMSNGQLKRLGGAWGRYAKYDELTTESYKALADMRQSMYVDIEDAVRAVMQTLKTKGVRPDITDEEVEAAVKAATRLEQSMENLAVRRRAAGIGQRSAFGIREGEKIVDATGEQKPISIAAGYEYKTPIWRPRAKAQEEAEGLAGEVMQAVNPDIKPELLQPQVDVSPSPVYQRQRGIRPLEDMPSEYATSEMRGLGETKATSVRIQKNKELKLAGKPLLEVGEGKPLITELDIARWGGRKVTADEASIGFAKIIEGARVAGDPDFVELLYKARPYFTNDQATQSFLKATDYVLNTWRKFATIYSFPMFPARNFLSNHFLLWTEDLWSPYGWDQAIRLGWMKPEDLADKTVDLGKNYGVVSASELMKRAEDHGAWVGMPEMLQQVGNQPLGRRIEKPLAEANQRFVEDTSRLAGYITALRQGLDWESAAAAVDRALYNYSPDALSITEKEVLRRLIPFYTFTKQNTKHMFQLLFEKPRKLTVISHARDVGYNVTGVDQESVPPYLRNLFGIPLPVGQGGVTFLSTGGVIPIADLERIFPAQNLREFSREQMSAMNPFLRDIIEFTTNKDIYRDLPLQEYPGQKKRAPDWITGWDTVAQNSPQIMAVWEPIMDRLGLVRKTTEDGDAYIAGNAYSMKLINDLFPFMQGLGRVFGPNAETGAVTQFTGVKLVPYSPKEWATQRAFTEQDILQGETRRLKAEDLLAPAAARKKKPAVKEFNLKGQKKRKTPKTKATLLKRRKK